VTKTIITDKKTTKVSTPGRICLFGEHQDYLGLPVIAMAIDLRLVVEGSINQSSSINVDLKDLNESDVIPLKTGRLEYRSQKDFLRSAVNLFRSRGYDLPGIDAKIYSTIPLNSGTSSSTALITTFIHFLYEIVGEKIDPLELATMAHAAEVVEFNAPGGMMDHMSVAFGGVQMIHFKPEPEAHNLTTDLGTFVLGDSLEDKDTFGVLSRIQNPLNKIDKSLGSQGSGISEIQSDDVLSMLNGYSDHKELLFAAIENRELTIEAAKELKKDTVDPVEIGRLLDRHQEVLRRRLKVSTPRIDAMLKAAKDAGALGGKINGSGGGGAMFAYAPENPERVVKAIEEVGGKAVIVKCDAGVKVHR